MQALKGRAALVLVMAAALLSATACGRTARRAEPSPAPSHVGQGATTSPSAAEPGQAEGPVAAESNPPGDIPDSVQFVEYHSAAGGYSLKVPEGWARTESGGSVAFEDKLTAVHVEVQPAADVPTPETVRRTEEPVLAATVRAFKETSVEPAALPGGKGVLLRYQANSEPDRVTGRQVRLEVDRYELSKDGRMAVVSLSAPAGSDNVDVWRLVSRSFRWAP